MPAPTIAIDKGLAIAFASFAALSQLRSLSSLRYLRSSESVQIKTRYSETRYAVRHVGLFERGDLLGRRVSAKGPQPHPSDDPASMRRRSATSRPSSAAARPARPARAARPGRPRPRRRFDDQAIGVRELRIERLAEFVGFLTQLLSFQARVSRPRASGLHGITAMPWSTHSGSISRSSSRFSRLM